MDWTMMSGVAAFFATIVGLMAYLVYFASEDRKRSETVRAYQEKLGRTVEAISRENAEVRAKVTEWEQSVHTFLENTETIVEDIRELKSANQTVRPHFTTFIANQWRIFDRMSRYRHEKFRICQHIVDTHIRKREIILLDSGSTVDQITSQLVARPISEVVIYSNNVLAAMHLTGTDVVSFHLFHGEFFQRSWAVYSNEANHLIEKLPITKVVIAAAAFDAEAGIYVRNGENGNHDFKRAAVNLFVNKSRIQLVLGVDASKFYEDRQGHHPIFDATTWTSILSRHASRICVVTSSPPRDATAANHATFLYQIAALRAAGVAVDLVEM